MRIFTVSKVDLILIFKKEENPFTLAEPDPSAMLFDIEMAALRN